MHTNSVFTGGVGAFACLLRHRATRLLFISLAVIFSQGVFTHDVAEGDKGYNQGLLVLTSSRLSISAPNIWSRVTITCCSCLG